METMTGLLNAPIVKLCLQKEWTFKVLGWAVCVRVSALYIQILLPYLELQLKRKINWSNNA